MSESSSSVDSPSSTEVGGGEDGLLTSDDESSRQSTTDSLVSTESSSDENHLDTPGILLKILLLMLAVNPPMGVFYAFDSVGAAAASLERHNITDPQQLGFFYVAYFVPGTVFSILVGILVDKIGLRVMAVATLVPLTLGSIVVCIGGKLESFWWIILGRALTGFGEATLVVQSAMVGLLFTGTWRDMAFSVFDVWSHVGTVLVFVIIPYLAPMGLVPALSTAIGFTAFVLLTNIIYVLIDIKLSQRKEHAAIHGRMTLSDIKRIPPVFWFISLGVSLNQAHFFSGMSFAVLFLTQTTEFSEEQAGLIISMSNLLTVLTPASAWLASKSKHRCLFWLVGSSAMVVIYFGLAFKWAPLALLLSLGVAFTMINATLLSSIPIVVEPSVIGTAYGIQAVMFDVWSIAFPLLLGIFRTNTGDWEAGYVFLASVAIVQLLCIIAVTKLDYTHNYFSTAEQKKRIFSWCHSTPTRLPFSFRRKQAD